MTVSMIVLLIKREIGRMEAKEKKGREDNTREEKKGGRYMGVAEMNCRRTQAFEDPVPAR